MNYATSLATRRNAILTIVGGGVFALSTKAQQGAMEEKPTVGPNAARTSLHFDETFAAAPQQLYGALLDQKQFAALTGLPATIDPAAGGAFALFNGMIVGRNVELIANRRLVQAWRPTHWGAGIYSVVHFEFSASGSGSALAFDHTGFPAGEFDNLNTGWQSHYWEALRKVSAS